MTKQEFEERIGKPIANGDYKIVELVYTYHPSISETKGKEQIASLYCEYGMRIISDMQSTALKARYMQDKIMQLEGQIEVVKEDYAKLKEA